jgi:hypothetical protein
MPQALHLYGMDATPIGTLPPVQIIILAMHQSNELEIS